MAAEDLAICYRERRCEHPMKRQAYILCSILTAICLTLQARTIPEDPVAPVLDAGNLLVVVNGRLKGDETYQLTRRGKSVALHSTTQYPDPLSGHNLSLSGDLRTFDGHLLSFELMGYTPSGTQVRTLVALDGSDVVVTSTEGSKKQKAPKQFFAIAGSLPAMMHVGLLQYWTAEGRPPALPVFPRGSVSIQLRGEDSVEVMGQRIPLKRYAISGVLWCRETVWVDSKERLVALVTHYQADDVPTPVQVVRDGYLSVLPFFIKKAVEDDEVEFVRSVNASFQPQQSKVALVGGTLVDGTGAPAKSDSVVVVQGDRIVAAGRRAEVKLSSDTAIVDLKGKTILPGLWDMHLHSFSTEWLVGELAGGITTARDCGSQFEFITAVRDVIRSGQGVGPRLLLVGTTDTSGEPFEGGMELRVLSPGDAREAVRRFHAAGFEQSKVFEDMTPDLLRAITEESHRLNMTVTGHLPAELTPFEAVEAGMDGIEHTLYILPAFVPKGTAPPAQVAGIDKLELLALQVDLSSSQFKEAVEFFVKHRTVIDPTLVISERWGHPKTTPMSTFQPGVEKMPQELALPLNADGLDAPSAEVWQRAFDKELGIVGALHKAGVIILAGSDARIPGHEFHRELELLVKAGLTPMQAIQAATIVPARVMKMDGELGTIEAGKLADLVVVDGNPLENISSIRNVTTVMKDGRMYYAATLWQAIGFKP